jgi:hypothetical protein
MSMISEQCTTNKPNSKELHSTTNYKALSQDDRRQPWCTSSMEFIRDPIAFHLCRWRGGSLKGWRTDDWRMRRSKRGDHGPVNPAYGEKMQSRNMKEIRARTLLANTIEQPACAPTLEMQAKGPTEELRLSLRWHSTATPTSRMWHQWCHRHWA